MDKRIENIIVDYIENYKNLNIKPYLLNPVILVDFKMDKVIGRADNVRIEGNELVCDLFLQDELNNVDDLYPAIGYLLTKDGGEELMSIALCNSQNLDKRIQTIGEQKKGNDNG